MKHRRDKRTHQAITDLNNEIEQINEARSKLNSLHQQAGIIRPVLGDAELIVRDVVAKQNGHGNMEGATLAEVLQIGETTDINTAKWIKETNADPELCLLRQAIINKNEREITLNYKLFKGELSWVNMVVVILSNKLAVPRSLLEW